MRPAFAIPVLLAVLVAAAALGGCGEKQEPTIGPRTDFSTTTVPPTTTTTTHGTGLPKQRCPKAESPPNITQVISHGADCGAVEDAMAKLRSVSREFRIGDFECKRASGARLGGTWECRGEASYFTFEFAD
jgi:hypothetical protein